MAAQAGRHGCCIQTKWLNRRLRAQYDTPSRHSRRLLTNERRFGALPNKMKGLGSNLPGQIHTTHITARRVLRDENFAQYAVAFIA